MSKEAHAAKLVELSLGRRGEQKHAAHFRKREGDKSMYSSFTEECSSLSLLAAFITLLNAKRGRLDVGPRLS